MRSWRQLETLLAQCLQNVRSNDTCADVPRGEPSDSASHPLSIALASVVLGARCDLLDLVSKVEGGGHYFFLLGARQRGVWPAGGLFRLSRIRFASNSRRFRLASGLLCRRKIRAASFRACRSLEKAV